MDYQNAPTYVKVGLWGIGTRRTALIYMWFCIIAAVVAVTYFAQPIALVLLPSALWYWYAIKWMDTHDGWRSKSAQRR